MLPLVYGQPLVVVVSLNRLAAGSLINLGRPNLALTITVGAIDAAERWRDQVLAAAVSAAAAAYGRGGRRRTSLQEDDDATPGARLSSLLF